MKIKKWNEKYDCGFIRIPENLNKSRALAVELRINYGIAEIGGFYFIADIMNKKNLKNDLFKLSEKYGQNISFFPENFLNIIDFDKEVRLSHGFISSTQAMLAGKIIKSKIK